MRGLPDRVAFDIDGGKALPLPEADRPRQERMGVQVQAFNACLQRMLAQFGEQLGCQTVAAVARGDEQAHDLHRFARVIVQLRKAMIVRQIADAGDELAMVVVGNQKMAGAVDIRFVEGGQVRRHGGAGEQWKKAASGTVDEAHGCGSGGSADGGDGPGWHAFGLAAECGDVLP